MENEACGSSGVTCTKSVTISITEDSNTVAFKLVKDTRVTRSTSPDSERSIGLPFKDDTVGEFC